MFLDDVFYFPESHDFLRIREQKDIEFGCVRVVLSPDIIVDLFLFMDYLL